MQSERVVIAGAGPVGLSSAVLLARAGIPVLVLEAEPELPRNLRASTFHPPTLDMLASIDAARPIIEQGLRAPRFQYRDRRDGLIAQFDFELIADLTDHPYRLQCEQFKLNEVLLDQLRGLPGAAVRFGAPVADVTQHNGSITAHIAGAHPGEERGSYLIGADGATSAIREALAIPFEGFTWKERFLVASTPFDYYARFADLTEVNYVADPEEWYFLLKVPGLWRVMFPTRADEDDEAILSESEVQRRLRRVFDPGVPVPVAHRTLYRVHQRVAERYRSGRGFIAGDAAHINNPLGGMGMNGGIHDAFNLARKLIAVIGGEAPESRLDRYERERRPVALEYINQHSIRNKRNLETADLRERAAFRRMLIEAAADRDQGRALLRRVSMVASLSSETPR